MKHYQLNGVTPRRHGNLKRRPWNAADFCDKERAVAFIKNFAEVHAIPLPGRMPKFYDYNIMPLPTDASKASVYREYVTATKVLEETSDQSVRCFGYRDSVGCGQKWCHLFELCHQQMIFAKSVRTMRL